MIALALTAIATGALLIFGPLIAGAVVYHFALFCFGSPPRR